ncbi:MAG: sugar-binding domain-containing protein [Limisphaerales bacterium]
MKIFARLILAAAVLCGLLAANPVRGGDQSAAPLPAGVKAVWDADKAYRETTPTRERICLNGLWQWQPAGTQSDAPPAENWGYFKVPGDWPGITDYDHKQSQTVFAHSSWAGQNLGEVTAAWYRRDLTVPANWVGRRIALRLDYLNSYAAVWVDGKRAGEVRFPGGELDITDACPSGAHTLSLLVAALPLKAVMLSYIDSAHAREVKGSVERRGLCGDVYLVSMPQGPRMGDVRIDTSVRKKECTFDVAVEGLAPGANYTLSAQVKGHSSGLRQFTSHPFTTADLRTGRVSFTGKWLPKDLWDTDTPQNIYQVQLSLLDAQGQVLDTSWPTRLGFREFWIAGRDFYLNGTRIFLSAVPLDNCALSAATATYDAARESFERLKSFGINYVYAHNYGCEPGSYLGFEEILRAADDTGMLVGFSMPHFSHYEWKSPDADQTNGYARHAEYFVRAAQNHPSVVMYSMSHNGTGYDEDMNPDLIDGIHAPRDQWGERNAKLALRAEAVVKKFDPGRIVYHHASGNLGSMHAINFYPNWVPVQELSDWFEHWATNGVKPVFTCEYGAPFTWDWAMYRGWYKGQREWGSAVVPWELCIAEWNAQFYGDRAFQISEAEKQDLRWAAAKVRNGQVWHRWDYPADLDSKRFDERYPIFAQYITDNWRAFRTWGISGNSPWEHEHFWQLRPNADRGRRDFKVDWDDLQRPGFSPDYEDQRYERMDLAYERSDWIPTPAAEALLRNNRPLLAYIAGQPARFTSKDHDFLPGETVEKQIIVINDSRETVKCKCQWSFGLPVAVTGRQTVTVGAGQQERILLRCELPAALPPGAYELGATMKFSNGETQADSVILDVLPAPVKEEVNAKIALFDPKGETGALLKQLGIQSTTVEAGTDLSGYDILVVGKSALTADGPAPDVGRVPEGLKVIVFEQGSDVLAKRFGFRVQEYGLRQVFPRIPNHSALAGITTNYLHDWRGAATLLPPRLEKYETKPRYGPLVEWAGLSVPHLWRCGNQGDVASVLIEKPAFGDFLPIVDGGFSLQYSPLLEYREGMGLVLFCQLDVTGRTEPEPAAEILARNLLQYVSSWKPAPRREAVYAGDPAGKGYLESTGMKLADYNGGPLSPNQVLIAGPGAGRVLTNGTTAIANWLKSGGNLLALGFDQTDTDALLPFKVSLKKAEHISSCFETPGLNSPFVGIGPADVHNRDPRELPLVESGARSLGDGVLASVENANVVFCQLEPWQFGPDKPGNFRRTHRRAAYLVSRLLANMGVAAPVPMLERFRTPVKTQSEQRLLVALYSDQPEEWDDPYRFFRW